MTRVAALIGLGLIALAVMVAPATSRIAAGAHGAAEGGYPALINRLADAGLLRVVPVPGAARTGRARIAFDADRIAALEEECGPAGCAALLDRLSRATFLGSDMLRADPATWRMDGPRVLGLAPYAHDPPRAGPTVAGWTGEVRYRGEPDRRALLLVDVADRRPVARFGGTAACVLPVAARAKTVCPGGATADAVAALDVAVPGHAGIRLRRLGDHLLVTTPSRLKGVALAIDGRPFVPPAMADRRSDAMGQVLVAPGQTIGVTAEGAQRTFQLAESLGVVSRPGAGGRLREPSLAALLVPVEQAAPATAVESTIRFELQRALVSHLEVVSQPYADRNRPLRSAAVMMDGLSGAVVALATFPTRSDQLAAAERESAQGLTDLNSNFALTPLAVGSTAKVPFAAAIVQAYPDLAGMTVACEPGRFGTVGGVPLRSAGGRRLTLGDHCLGERTGFREFIAFSSNRYALVLMETARRRLARTGPQPGDWRERLHALSCLIPYSRRASGRDQGWRGRAEGCGEPLWRAPDGRPLQPAEAGLPRTYLRLNAIENVYPDYYQSILGGNRAYMPLAGLAQAYARTISGRAVPLRLSGPETAAPLFEDMNVRVWRAVLDGMWGTIARGGGTARASLAPFSRAMLGHGRGLFLLAKTGTPTVERRDASGELVRGEGNVLVLATLRTWDRLAPDSPDDICALRIVAINFQDRQPGLAAPAPQLVNALVAGNASVRDWLTPDCDRAEEAS